MAWKTWVSEAWSRVEPYAQELALWRGYEQELQTLLLYGVGIALYTALVFTFYQSISRREAPHTRRKPGAWGDLVHFLESWLVFPAMSFLYFGLLALALFLLAKSQTTSQILLTSMAVIVGVRVTAYLSQGMSVDLAKLVPLGLLGVLLVDPGHLSLEVTLARVQEAIAMAPLLARYFLLFILFEGAMQAARHAWHRYLVWAHARRDMDRYAPLPPARNVRMVHAQKLDLKAPPPPERRH